MTPTSPCTHIYAFKYLLSPCIHTHFQYRTIPPINYTKPEGSWKFKISWMFLKFWVTFRFFKSCINRSQNTKWKPKTYKMSTMNKIEIKKKAKIRGCMWCQLLYLIPGAILCLKFNYSDVTSMKPALPQSLSFFFLCWENLQKWKIYIRNTYVLNIFDPLPLYAPVRFCHDSSSPYLRTYFMDDP